MSAQMFTNLATSLLAGTINAVATSVQVSTGQGALFPSPGAGQYFVVTVEDASGNVEIMKCTSRSTDILTVVRGQEGTTAQSFTANLARVEVRETAGTFNNFLQKSGDTMSGDLNMGTHNITSAVLGSGSSVQNANEIVNTPIRGATGISTNELAVPTNGTDRATAGGLKILCEGDPLPAFTIGQIMLWYGAAIDVPALWHVCDGSTVVNSQSVSVPTPDLRDRFVVGAGTSYALGATGGAASVTSSSVNATPAATDSHTLVVGEMPGHTHTLVSLMSIHYGSGGGEATVIYTNTPAGSPQPGGTSSTGGGGGHTHTLTGSAHAHSVATLPPYYGLFYIMYVG